MEPLASRIRPKTLKEFEGQEHLVGEEKPLNVAIKQKHLFSFIFWGPPGTGKTTLAKIYANSLKARFYELSAVSAGKADIRKILAEDTGEYPKILFLDEIHRFNKSQQDFLLPFVERGEITLIGATTENPSFEVISPLLSRCRVFVLKLNKSMKQKQLEKLRKEIIKKAFIENWKDVWFYPKYKGVKGWLGTKKVIFIGSNPSYNAFPTKHTDLFYEQLKKNGFQNAHLTDLIKVRATGKEANEVIEENLEEQKLFLHKEIKIVNPILIVVMGRKTENFAKRFGLKDCFYIPHYSNPFLKNNEPFIRKMKELRKKLK